jgi:ligand-binding sensor domain-containing protein
VYTELCWGAKTDIPLEMGTRLHTGKVLHDPFVWFGSEYGLNRYDGYKFKVFKHEPGSTNSLSGVYIYSLFKDRSGSPWIGCEGFLKLRTHRPGWQLNPDSESTTQQQRRTRTTLPMPRTPTGTP